MSRRRVKDFRYKLIPLFADVIKPDAEMTRRGRQGARAVRGRTRARRRADGIRCFTGAAISTARSTI